MQTQKERYMKLLSENFTKGYELMEAKNADYADNDDPLANFRGSELVGVSKEKGILVRMTDKIKRVSNLLEQEAQVKDESIEDTLLDLMNYSNILLAAIRLQKAADDEFATNPLVYISKDGEIKEA